MLPFLCCFFAVSSNALVLMYLVPFEMVIGIIGITSKLLLMELLLAMFWFVCLVIWVDSRREA